METLFQDLQKDIQIDYTANARGGQMSGVHYHNAYEIYILEKGERTYIIDDTFLELTDHDVALIAPYELHITDGSSYSRHVLYFNDAYLDRYFSANAKKQLLSLFDAKKLSLSESEHKTLKQLLLMLAADTENFLVFCRLMHLLVECKGRSTDHTISKKNKLISGIVEYVAKHYLEIESLDTLARNFFITKHYLCRLFKKETGVTIITYINTQKIQLACEMLKFTKKSIEEIAAACGFNSSMYFCKLFKETLKCSPGTYRKQTQI